jgi:serine/threonine protein kinase
LSQACKLYTGQMLSGLEYLHGQGFIHGLLQPSNVLIDAKVSRPAGPSSLTR